MNCSKLALCMLSLAPAVVGCATSSDEQRKAEVHQYKSDEAASNGQFGVAGDEQRKAADSHHSAVRKAIDEGTPIPRQTQMGDPYPDAGS